MGNCRIGKGQTGLLLAANQDAVLVEAERHNFVYLMGCRQVQAETREGTHKLGLVAWKWSCLETQVRTGPLCLLVETTLPGDSSRLQTGRQCHWSGCQNYLVGMGFGLSPFSLVLAPFYQDVIRDGLKVHFQEPLPSY
jgi:hypothetical protein